MKKVLVLGSSIALGVYTPAVWLCRSLEKRGVECRLICLENLYTEEKRNLVDVNKYKFHKNFKLAKAAHAMENHVVDTVDEEAKEQFLEECIREEYDSIVCVSGFWVSIMEELMDRAPVYRNRVKALRMDSVTPNSWKHANCDKIQKYCLFDLESNTTPYKLSDITPKAAGERSGRIVAHGGGWGLGTYRKTIGKLNEMGFPVDIICCYEDEYDENDKVNRYFLLDPTWKASEHQGEFPPNLIRRENGWEKWNQDSGISDMLALLRDAVAVVTKPGGGTLADSMVACTPILFLEALAGYEQKNAQMWIQNGYGMPFEDWAACDDPRKELEIKTNKLLQDMHDVKVLGEEIYGK